jgi:hypothetical protein
VEAGITPPPWAEDGGWPPLLGPDGGITMPTMPDGGKLPPIPGMDGGPLLPPFPMDGGLPPLPKLPSLDASMGLRVPPLLDGAAPFASPIHVVAPPVSSARPASSAPPAPSIE